MQNKPVPKELLIEVISKIESKYGSRLPFKIRGITISEQMVSTTLEILNEEKTKTLPQNAYHNNAKDTPDGLDKRLKIRMGSNTCKGHIISDILFDVGVVNIHKIRNIKTGKLRNVTELTQNYTW